MPWGSKAVNPECSFFMARQPIFDGGMRLIGHELLYRKSGTARHSAITREDELAALATVLIEVGLDRLAMGKPAYVNVPVSLLASKALRMLPKDRVVLEILEDTPWCTAVEQNLGELKDLGYRLALDDYTFGAEHGPFLEHVDIVKVDVLGVPYEQLKEKMRGARRRGKVFLAEKVESNSMLDLCRSLDFNYFQGNVMAQPVVVRGTGIPCHLALSIGLLAKLNDPNASLAEIDRLLSGNVVLCHKILRLVNSVDMSLSMQIDTVRRAVEFLGIDRVRTLASLAVATGIRGKPPELYTLALVRANYCEALAKSAGFPTPEKHYLVGLFSVLDALTNVSMKELLAELPLAVDVSAALRRENPKAPCSATLRHILAVESGDWAAADDAISGVPSGLYLDAVGRAMQDEQLLAA